MVQVAGLYPPGTSDCCIVDSDRPWAKMICRLRRDILMCCELCLRLQSPDLQIEIEGTVGFHLLCACRPALSQRSQPGYSVHADPQPEQTAPSSEHFIDRKFTEIANPVNYCKGILSAPSMSQSVINSAVTPQRLVGPHSTPVPFLRRTRSSSTCMVTDTRINGIRI
jgi:hypothetical protein